MPLPATPRCAVVAVVCALALGCGPVRLGSEPVHDAGEAPSVAVSIRVASSCGGCFTLRLEADGGAGPYAYQWEDGAPDPSRELCVDGGARAVTGAVTDSRGAHASAALELTPGDAGCPAPSQQLCLKNGSFEGTPAYNAVVAPAFDCVPWLSCSKDNPGNSPDVVNDTIQQFIAVPAPTDGNTYLGLAEHEQVSQLLCEPLPGGSRVHLLLDVGRFVFGGVTELPFLTIWGGLSADCSQRELLWASGPLGEGLSTLCATLEPSQYMDQLTLRALADDGNATIAYLLVDNLRPVAACPNDP